MSGEGSTSDVEDESDEEGGPPRHRLPAWRPVALDSARGAAPSRARAPQLHILANPAPDTSCLQLDGGLCATGESGADGQVHLWSTEDDELEFRRSLAGHPQGVTTLSFQVGTFGVRRATLRVAGAAAALSSSSCTVHTALTLLLQTCLCCHTPDSSTPCPPAAA